MDQFEWEKRSASRRKRAIQETTLSSPVVVVQKRGWGWYPGAFWVVRQRPSWPRQLEMSQTNHKYEGKKKENNIKQRKQNKKYQSQVQKAVLAS
jgi:hypothetical protein